MFFPQNSKDFALSPTPRARTPLHPGARTVAPPRALRVARVACPTVPILTSLEDSESLKYFKNLFKLSLSVIVCICFAWLLFNQSHGGQIRGCFLTHYYCFLLSHVTRVVLFFILWNQFAEPFPPSTASSFLCVLRNMIQRSLLFFRFIQNKVIKTRNFHSFKIPCT